MSEKCIGRIEVDPIGLVLGTDYKRFYSPSGIDGLCREAGDTLNLLAVDARKPGTGQFRRFIDQAKASYLRIFIWQVGNPFLPSVLERYGFRPVEGGDIINGQFEQLTGYRWDK